MSAQRVTVFAGDLGPTAVGRWRGNVRLHGLIECLLHLGIEVQVVGFGPAEGLGSLQSRVAVHVEPRRTVPAGFIDLLRAARNADGSLLLAHKPRPLSLGVALLAQKLRRRPLVLDVDDDELQFAPTSRGLRPFLQAHGPWRRLEHRRILRWLEGLSTRAQRVTAATTTLARYYEAQVLRTPRDLDQFDPKRFDRLRERQRLDLELHQRLLLFAGAPRPYKGLEDLLTAMDQIQTEPPFHLLVLGGSPYDDYHEELRQRWPRQVTVRPAEKPREIPAYLAAADLVVVPQRDTAITRCQLPLKLLDAMAMAKPVLVTRVGDLPDLVGDDALLAEPDNPDSLCLQLVRFLEKPQDAHRRGQALRQRAEQQISVEAVSRQLRQLLEQAGEDE